MFKYIIFEIVKLIVVYIIKIFDWESLNVMDSFGNNVLYIVVKFVVLEVFWKFWWFRFKDFDKDGNIFLYKVVWSGEDLEGFEIMLDIFEMMNCDGNVN